MTEFLTDLEKETVVLLGKVHMNMCTIVGHDTTRMEDLTESCHHVHVLQRMVMAQAAARAYPKEFRLLGCLLPGADQE